MKCTKCGTEYPSLLRLEVVSIDQDDGKSITECFYCLFNRLQSVHINFMLKHLAELL